MATAVGANSQAAHSILKTEYVEGISLSTAKQLSLKVLKQTMDSTILIPDKVELSELAWQDGVPGQVSYRLVRGVELRDLCIAVNRENMLDILSVLENFF